MIPDWFLIMVTAYLILQLIATIFQLYRNAQDTILFYNQRIFQEKEKHLKEQLKTVRNKLDQATAIARYYNEHHNKKKVTGEEAKGGK